MANRARSDLRGRGIFLELDLDTFLQNPPPGSFLEILIKRSTSAISLFHDDSIPIIFGPADVATLPTDNVIHDEGLEEATIYYYRVWQRFNDGIIGPDENWESNKDLIIIGLSLKRYRDIVYEPDYKDIQALVTFGPIVAGNVYGVTVHGANYTYLAAPGDTEYDVVDSLILSLAGVPDITTQDDGDSFQIFVDMAYPNPRIPLVVSGINDTSVELGYYFAPKWFREFVADIGNSSVTQRKFMDYIGNVYGFYRNLINVFGTFQDNQKILWQIASDFLVFYRFDPDKEDLSLQRRLINDLVYLFQRKGNCRTIIRAVKIVTGWDGYCESAGGPGYHSRTFHTYDGQSYIHKFLIPGSAFTFDVLAPDITVNGTAAGPGNQGLTAYAVGNYYDWPYNTDYDYSFCITAFGEFFAITDLVQDTALFTDTLNFDGVLPTDNMSDEFLNGAMISNTPLGGNLHDLVFPAGTFIVGQLAGLQCMLNVLGTPEGQVLWNTDDTIRVESADPAFTGTVSQIGFSAFYTNTGTWATRDPHLGLTIYPGRHALLFDTRDFTRRDTRFEEFWYLINRSIFERPLTSTDAIYWTQGYAEESGRTDGYFGTTVIKVNPADLVVVPGAYDDGTYWINPNRNQDISYRIVGTDVVENGFVVDLGNKPPIGITSKIDERFYIFNKENHRKDSVIRNSLDSFYSKFRHKVLMYHDA